MGDGHRSSRGFVALLVWGVIAAGAGSLRADHDLSPEEKKEGFKLLFNGHDLDGWREVQGKPGAFWVKDHCIEGERRKADGTAYWLSTNEKYGNFVLRLQFYLPKDGNGGVFIRVPSYEGRTSKTGMEIQLMDDYGKEIGPGNTGSIYQVVPPKALVAHAETWNDVEITCNGDNIRVVINGKEVNNANMSEHAALKSRPREGYLGLSAHTKVVKYRNIRLRQLPNSSSPSDSKS